MLRLCLKRFLFPMSCWCDCGIVRSLSSRHLRGRINQPNMMPLTCDDKWCCSCCYLVLSKKLCCDQGKEDTR